MENCAYLRKNPGYAPGGKELSWFKSHLSNEKQFLMVRDGKSTSGDLFCIVPQGSVFSFVFSLSKYPRI